MFEFNGMPITLEQVEESAKESNMDIDSYIKKAEKDGLIDKRKPIELGKSTPTTPGAVVEKTAAPVMDSKPENGSLEYTEIEPFKEFQQKKSIITEEGQIELRQAGDGEFQPIELKEVVVTGKDKTKIAEARNRDIRIKNIAATTNIPKTAISMSAGIAATTIDILGGFMNLIDKYGVAPVNYAIGKSLGYDTTLRAEVDASIENYEVFENVSNLLRQYTIKKYDKEGNEQDTFSLIEQGNYIDAAELAFNEGFSAAPYLALSIASPVYGSALIGSSVTGQEVQRALKERPEATLEEIYGASAAKGGVEFFTNMIGGGMQRGILGIGKKLGVGTNAYKEAVDIYTKTYLGKVADAGIGLTRGGITNFIEEWSASMGSAIVDSAVYNDPFEFKSANRQAINEGLIGLALGSPVGSLGAFNSIASKQQALEFLAPKQWNIELSKQNRRLEEAKFDLNNAPENRKEKFQKRVQKIESLIKMKKQQLQDSFDNLTKKEKKQYANNLNKSAESIAQIGNSKYTLAAQEIAKKDFNEANKQNEILVGKEIFDADIEKNISKTLKNTERIEEAFQKAKQEVKNVKFEYISDIQADFDARFDPNTNTVTINKPIALKTEQTNVIGHELLHYMIAQKFATDNASMQPLVDSFKDYLKETQPEIYQRIQERIDINYTDDDGNIRSGALEEYFNIFSDLISKEKIIVNEPVADKIKNSTTRFLNGLGFGSVKLETGKDVFNFIRNYQKNISEFKFKQLGVDLKSSKIPQAVQQEIQQSKESISGDQIQKVFDEKGKDGAFDIIQAYKPLTSKLTNKYKNVPGFDFELLQSEIEIGKRGLLDLINAYDPSKGATLNTYIQGQLANRSIEAANRILDTDFKLDVTEAKGITDTTTEEITEDVIEKPSEKLQSLRKKMNIGDEIKPVVFDAVRKTFGTKLPSVTEKAFKIELEKSFRTELKKPIAKLMGRTEDYRSFLSNNFEAIYDALPQSIINKRLAEFAEPVMKDGKQVREKTAEGNKVFTKKKISKAEWIKYFLGSEVGRSTQGTRKTALAEALSEALGLDATMEVLSDPAIMQKAMDIAELQGIELTDNFVDKVSSIIGRPINFKFSKARTALNLPAGAIDFKNKSQVLSARKAMLELAKILGPEKAVQYLLPTVQGGWGSIGGKFIPEKDINKLIVKELEDPNDKNSFRTNQFLFIGRADFFEEAKKIFNSVEYKKRKRFVNINGEEIPILAVPKQTPKGFTSGKFEGKQLENRLYFARTQREGLEKIIDSIKELYTNNQITKNDVGMILATFNSSINALIRTAAYPGLQFKIDGLKDGDYRYEHTQTASDTLTDLAKYITIKDYKFTFNDIMQGFRVAIIPKSYDKIVNSTGFKSNGPRDTNGDLIKGRSTNVIRYNQKEVIEIFENENLPKLELEDLLTENLIVKPSKSLNKKLRVFDFDDTLAKSKSNVLYTMPNGTKGKLNAEQFAKQGDDLLQQGAEFDFSEFSKVIEGQKGPMFDVAKAILDKRGDEDLFILTARPAEAKYAIQPFLEGLGLPFRLENIIGLGNGSPQAKADWIASKLNLGYNDVYFADDALKNVQAVAKTLSAYDIKYRSQAVKASKSLDTEFNKILQESTGVEFYKEYSPVKAELLGRGKGKFKFFVPYDADDFVGLLYTTLAKGKSGDAQMEWYKENLLKPFSRGIQQYEAAKQRALRDWADLKAQIKKDVPAGLNKQNETGFRNQDSVRVYIWHTQGADMTSKEMGMSKSDLNDNLKYIRNNPALKAFADKLMALNVDGYPDPTTNWTAGDITTDLVSYINDVKRKEYLQPWKDNIDIIFSDKNKNKLKALYGNSYIESLDDMLYRMWNGRNRRVGITKKERAFQDWINNSVGTVMFFNSRSALLQTISAINFINFTDNNPINAAAAFANQKQYWTDFSELFNSDFLKQRRSGLQIDINADEIASAAATSRNKAKAALSAILKFGFTPTQIADSFAIASGGATFYRNRIKKYLKEGLTQEEAQKKAFEDFQETAEESQQSARPDRISMQQASSLGRTILAWGNTPMQYARIQKKAALDLINGRGDWKTNVSKIMYYGVIQNIIFSALQQGMFALLFSDEEDEKEKERYFRVGNSMLDTFLRGAGIYGAVASTAKNVIMEIIDQAKSSRPDYTQAAIAATTISPPVNSKLRKLISAGKTFTYKQSKEKVFTEGFSLENPAFLAGGQVISAVANIPVDRIVQKADHIYTAMKPETELWQSIALSLGWSEWDLNMIEKQTKKPSTIYKTSKSRGSRKSRNTR